MYNGIGLATPRGSGTNGHVQRNWALVRPREKEKSYKTEQELQSFEASTSRQPNKDILDHERKRKIELKCAEFAEMLEGQDFSEETIKNKVDNYRKMLIGQGGKLEKPVDKWGRTNVTETHQVAEAQQEKNARLREAFGISEYFVDGSSFDADRQAKEKLAKSAAIQERERQKELERENERKKEQEDAARYQLVHTPSPEPAEKDEKKKKKRKRKVSTSSEEPKKKKKKKNRKKEKSTKPKDKKKRKQRKTETSDESESSSDKDSDSEDEKKKKKSKKKEKKKTSRKKKRSASQSSRDSSSEPKKSKSKSQPDYSKGSRNRSPEILEKSNKCKRSLSPEIHKRHSEDKIIKKNYKDNFRGRSPRRRENNEKVYERNKQSNHYAKYNEERYEKPVKRFEEEKYRKYERERSERHDEDRYTRRYEDEKYNRWRESEKTSGRYEDDRVKPKEKDYGRRLSKSRSPGDRYMKKSNRKESSASGSRSRSVSAEKVKKQLERSSSPHYLNLKRKPQSPSIHKESVYNKSLPTHYSRYSEDSSKDTDRSRSRNRSPLERRNISIEKKKIIPMSPKRRPIIEKNDSFEIQKEHRNTSPMEKCSSKGSSGYKDVKCPKEGIKEMSRSPQQYTKTNYCIESNKSSPKQKQTNRSCTPDAIINAKECRRSRSTTPELPKDKIQKKKERSHDKSPKPKKQQPVVRLRASSSEPEPSGNEVDKEDEFDDKELRMLRLLKSGLAAKAKENLEKKKENPVSPKQLKRPIQPDLFDIKVLPLRREKSTSPKINKDDFDIANGSGNGRKSRSRSKSGISRDKSSKSRSRSSSRSSATSQSRSSSSSSRSSHSSRSNTRSRSRSGSRSSSSSYASSSSSRRSRSTSIPIRHGSPSFLSRRRITSNKKR